MGKYEEDEDDGRVIVNMNVEGMPGYRENRKERQSKKLRPEGDGMTPKEARQFMLTATLTGLLVAAVFSIVIILFVLFCTKIWFA